MSLPLTIILCPYLYSCEVCIAISMDIGQKKTRQYKNVQLKKDTVPQPTICKDHDKPTCINYANLIRSSTPLVPITIYSAKVTCTRQKRR